MIDYKFKKNFKFHINYNIVNFQIKSLNLVFNFYNNFIIK